MILHGIDDIRHFYQNDQLSLPVYRTRMKISLEWLKEYVDLPADAGELVDVLPMLGLEVEEAEGSEAPSLDHVVVGEVLDKQPHPEADRLSVCQVNVGAEQPANIVCGATNFQVGDRVPVALPGAKLPGGFKIKKSKLRGVPSEGMMCSAKELQLGDDDHGLMILSDSPPLVLRSRMPYRPTGYWNWKLLPTGEIASVISEWPGKLPGATKRN